MTMRIDISISDELIETITLTRVGPFDPADDHKTYTYKGLYTRVKYHRTAGLGRNTNSQISRTPFIVYHKFSDGSLALVKSAINKLKEIIGRATMKEIEDWAQEGDEIETPPKFILDGFKK